MYNINFLLGKKTEVYLRSDEIGIWKIGCLTDEYPILTGTLLELKSAFYELSKFLEDIIEVGDSVEAPAVCEDIRKAFIYSCEKCHGPGPSLYSGTELRYLCGKCHEEPNDPFFQESDECDECNGSDTHFIDGKPQSCICFESQEVPFPLLIVRYPFGVDPYGKSTLNVPCTQCKNNCGFDSGVDDMGNIFCSEECARVFHNVDDMNEAVYPDYDEAAYKPTCRSDPIRCWKEKPKWPDGLGLAGWDGPGYYFWDETWYGLHGPFNTLEECKTALQYYAAEL